MNVTIDSQKITLSPDYIWKQGGEAEIYQLGMKALKVYKQPSHPHFITQSEHDGARLRIQEHQSKLPAFPKNVPTDVVAPVDLAYDDSNSIVGYTMPLITSVDALMRLSEKPYRNAGISNNQVLDIFRNLHKLVSDTHKANIVIGDFNDLNVLFNRDSRCYLIDADSFQYGQWFARMFTTIFVDPLLCNPKAKKLELVKHHNENSDWYAFAVMLMRSLLYVGPYGGVYRSKSPSKRITEPERPLYRLTVFNPDTRYPKPAMSLDTLPDSLLEQLQRIFEKDQRGIFPEKELEIRWTKCIKCGIEHARQACPICQQMIPSLKQTTVIRGKVKCVNVFRTTDQILHASVENGKLLWFYREDYNLKRETGVTVFGSNVKAGTRFRLSAGITYIGSNRLVTRIRTDSPTDNSDRRFVDPFDKLSMFDVNSKHLYYLSNGHLFRMDKYGQEFIGNVLQNKTLFWVGEKFGFGFYQAGRMTVGFVFDAEKQGINDTIKMPVIRGQLLDSTCFFSDDRCWFITSIDERGQRFNRCLVINSKGEIEAQAEANHDDGIWLSTLRGKLAIGKNLLCATDDGIIKVETSGGDIIEVEKYPNTASFVDTSCHLFPSKEGIYVVSEKEINLLSIRR